MAHARIGTSGWNYRHWRGVLYPPGVPTREWLAHYARVFDTVEVNTTFYGTPADASIARWRGAVDDGFHFAVKMSRFLTHVKRLEPDEPSMERFGRLLASFEPALGPVLIQLPPSLAFDPGRVDAFLARLPRGVDYALESRHPSWLTGEAWATLERHGVAWCLADSTRWSKVEAVTAPFTYLRFHGPGRVYVSSYDEAALERWARRIRRILDRGVDVWAYFNNDGWGYAVGNAKRLLELVGEPARQLRGVRDDRPAPPIRRGPFARPGGIGPGPPPSKPV
jgi:uncharacterized protein YecE (DUF72 family)